MQVGRLEGGSENHRVDLDFYLIAAWRLMEQIRQAWVGYQVPGAEDLWREFNTRFPYIDETRDWWIHATDRIVNRSYFANDIMRWTQPPTFVIRTDDLPELERIYERFCEVLGPSPSSMSATSGQPSEAAASSALTCRSSRVRRPAPPKPCAAGLAHRMFCRKRPGRGATRLYVFAPVQRGESDDERSAWCGGGHRSATASEPTPQQRR